MITSPPGKLTNAIYTLPNISRGKGNKTTKFSQLMKHNIRNILLEK